MGEETVDAVVLDTEYDELLKFVRAGLKKDAGGMSLSIQDIKTCETLVFSKLKVKYKIDGVPETAMIIIHKGNAYIVSNVMNEHEYLTFNCNYVNVFRIHHTSDIRKFRLKEGYDMVKMGMIKIYTHAEINKDEIDGIASLIKEMEKEELGDESNAQERKEKD